jgi:hypothetical protein
MMNRNVRILTAGVLFAGLASSSALAEGPISNITGKMTVVSGDLDKQKTGEPVQTRQKGIVRDLDELIAALEQQCQACKNGIKRNNPNRGMADSKISRGTGGIGDLTAPGESQKDWAKLSPRERDRILQSMSEGFPPEYRTVLERYYRRLAEEKTAPATNGNTSAEKP